MGRLEIRKCPHSSEGGCVQKQLVLEKVSINRKRARC